MITSAISEKVARRLSQGLSSVSAGGLPSDVVFAINPARTGHLRDLVSGHMSSPVLPGNLHVVGDDRRIHSFAENEPAIIPGVGYFHSGAKTFNSHTGGELSGAFDVVEYPYAEGFSVRRFIQKDSHPQKWRRVIDGLNKRPAGTTITRTLITAGSSTNKIFFSSYADGGAFSSSVLFYLDDLSLSVFGLNGVTLINASIDKIGDLFKCHVTYTYDVEISAATDGGGWGGRGGAGSWIDILHAEYVEGIGWDGTILRTQDSSISRSSRAGSVATGLAYPFADLHPDVLSMLDGGSGSIVIKIRCVGNRPGAWDGLLSCRETPTRLLYRRTEQDYLRMYDGVQTRDITGMGPSDDFAVIVLQWGHGVFSCRKYTPDAVLEDETGDAPYDGSFDPVGALRWFYGAEASYILQAAAISTRTDISPDEFARYL